VLVDAQHVLAHAERGHAIRVVQHTTKLRGRLASSERLPPRVRAMSLGMKGGPVHKISGAFVGAKEENLGLCVDIDDLLLDAGGLTRDEKIDGRVDVLLKRADVGSAERRQDDSLSAALRNVLVLEVLCRGERVVLVKKRALVDRVAPSKDKNVSMKSERGERYRTHSFPRERTMPRATSLKRMWKPRNSAPITKNMPCGFLGVLDLRQKAWCETEGERDLRRRVEVGFEHVPV